MHWFKSTKLETLEALFLDRLKNLLSMECLLTETIPRMAVSAESSVARDVLENLLLMARRHIQRLDLVFRQLAVPPSRGLSTELRILISDCEWPGDNTYDPSVRDAGLIAGAERFTHYKMADYVSAKCLAAKLGYSGVSETLKVSLDDEVAAEDCLIAVAQGTLLTLPRQSQGKLHEYRRTAEGIMGRI